MASKTTRATRIIGWKFSSGTRTWATVETALGIAMVLLATAGDGTAIAQDSHQADWGQPALQSVPQSVPQVLPELGSSDSNSVFDESMSPGVDLDAMQQQLQTLQSKVDQLDSQAKMPSSFVTGFEQVCNPIEAPNYHLHGRNQCNHIGCYYKRFDWSKDAYVSVGGGIRTSYVAAEDFAADGSSWSNDWRIDSQRLYFNGRGHKYLAFELNFDIANTQLRPFVTNSSGTSYHLLDGIVKIGDGGAFNVWLGRMLPPSDRSNLSGPFYVNNYDFPFVSNLPAIFDGRQDGVTWWGLLFNQSVKYQIGMYDGANSIVGGTNPSDVPQYNARLVWNLLDPETGYYNQSTYYGQKDILAIGATWVGQNDAFYSATNGLGNFNTWQMDLLAERKLSNDAVATFCGAYYDFNTGIQGNDINANSVDGRAYMLTAGYMLPQDFTFCMVSGRFRPVVRWQEYNRTFSAPSIAENTPTRGFDVEMQYVMYGHNARLSAVWGQRDFAGKSSTTNFLMWGAQMQF